MLAIRLKQKESVFYLAAYRAADLLRKVQFVGKAYEGEEESETAEDESVVAFFRKVQSGRQFFQRRPYARKVRQIADFYTDPMGQPLIPGAILLYTPERLAFDASGASQLMGNLHDPREPFLVIDGQHRLAGLEVLGQRQPETLEKIDVPCVIFDKSQADFAVEMFVIINSTPTRLNRSHLIDLYDRLQRATPIERAAAKAVALCYSETDSPLHRKIDMLGRRRKTERWIRQASLFRELRRLAEKNQKLFGEEPNAKALYEVTRDFLRAVRRTFADAWDHPRYHVTTDVTLMAMIRVLGDYLKSARGARTFEAMERQRAFEGLIDPWLRMVPEFRGEGFYERFAARGQVERVSVINRALANAIGVGARAVAEG
ncbi:MAG TPA: DGQHR domain-containing protein [Candidatus Binatia bacterium]|nr:DGQHR domain-containing protein [Candidatus Binatia bacterium]